MNVSSKISHMKSLVFWLLHAGLATTSVLFVKENLKDYIRIKTNFQESISDITTSDYPTLTICYEHQYQDMVFGEKS